ncbi:hypothetical protein HK101_006012 [Irineochytrium annulatum]|nr:hypothetical protein HK101_006012 [Irineochytrium annulatum]
MTLPKSQAIIEDHALRQLLAKQLTAGLLPIDPQGIYMIVAGTDSGPGSIITQSQAYCTIFCGYHSVVNVGTTTIHYAVSGIRCPYCGVTDVWQALQMTMSHEIAETTPLYHKRRP